MMSSVFFGGLHDNCRYFKNLQNKESYRDVLLALETRERASKLIAVALLTI